MKTYIVTFSGIISNRFNDFWTLAIYAHDPREAATIVRGKSQQTTIKGIRQMESEV